MPRSTSARAALGIWVSALALSVSIDAAAQRQPVEAAPAPPLASPPAARPAPASAQPLPYYQARTERHWYGWQTLVTDGTSLTLYVLGRRIKELGSQSAKGLTPTEDAMSDIMLASSVVGYFFGAPAVHWGHGHALKGFGSLGMRLVGPTLLFAFQPAPNNTDGPLLLFSFLAIIAPIPIDAAALAWEDVETDVNDGANHAPLSALRIAPVAHPEKRSAGLVLMGNF